MNSDYSGSEDGNDDKKKQEDQHLKKLRWTPQIEKLLINWADTAACYKWLHERSYRKYRKINYFYSIPIIILSTLTGTVSVGMSGVVPPQYTNISQIVVGFVSILTGIITTLQNFFRYAQTSESHYNSCIGWSRLQRNIVIELNLERKYRKKPGDFVKICRSEYDRLMEQSPLLPKDVIKKFKIKFGNIENLIIPDTVDNIRHADVYNDPEPDSDPEELDLYKPKPNLDSLMEVIQRPQSLPNFSETKRTILETSKSDPFLVPIVSSTNSKKALIDDIKNIKVNVKDMIKKINKDEKEPEKKQDTVKISLPQTSTNPHLENIKNLIEDNLANKYGIKVEPPNNPV